MKIQGNLQVTGDGEKVTVQDIDGNPTVANVDIIKFTNGAVTDNGDGSVTVAVSAGGVTDHGALTGLADDDHPQYARKAAEQNTFTGTLTAEAFYLRSGMSIGNEAGEDTISTPNNVLVHGGGTFFVETLGNISIATIPQDSGGLPGNITINTGNSTGSTNAPAVSIAGGVADDSGTGGDVAIAAGASLNSDGGDVTIDAGDAGGVGDGGNITIIAGTTVSGNGGNVTITAAPDGGVATVEGDDVVITANANNLTLSAAGAGVVEIDGTLGVNIDGAGAGVLFNSNILHNVADPAVAQDAATKNYVDRKFQQFYNNMGGGSALTVRDIDGAPTVTNVNTIRFTNGSVSDQGGGVAEVTIGGGGISTLTIGAQSFGSQTTLGFSGSDFYLSGGATTKVVNLRQSLESLSGYLDFGVVGNVFLEMAADHPSVISDIDLVCRSGSAICGFYIVPAAFPTYRDGTKVTGADPITVSTTPQKIRPTALNTMAVGDGLKMAIYQNGNAKGIRVKVHLRRS